MNTIDRKTRKDRKIKVTVTAKKNLIRNKETRRPGLSNDAVFNDSATSIDVCI